MSITRSVFSVLTAALFVCAAGSVIHAMPAPQPSAARYAFSHTTGKVIEQGDRELLSLSERDGKTTAVLNAGGAKVSVQPHQMVFKKNVFEKTNLFSLEQKNGKVVLSYPTGKFDLYRITTHSRNYRFDRPLMLGEVLPGDWPYDVSVSVIMQNEDDAAQLNYFYFLLPKDAP